MPIDTAVEVAKVAGSVAAHDLSVWGLIAQADLVVKFVMLMLMVASLLCWSIIFDKWSFFRKVKYKTTMFEKAYRSTRSLSQLYEKVNKKNPGDPMAEMFVAGVNEVKRSPARAYRSSPEATSIMREKIGNSLHRVKTVYLEKMEKNLIFLATVGSASPFIGLFGTVWGIVNSFQAIAATKNTTLAVVAPGIAEALLATAIGLFAAIPAVIFYNLFSNQIRQTSGKLDDYAIELGTTLVYQDE
jgi:biopolymer transport protein TolQ